MRPKIHILYKFVEGPWGGGNQFLKILLCYFREARVYSESPEDADVILFNSYPFSSEYLFNLVFKLKWKSDKILIHRVDGPISYVRGTDKTIDKIIFLFNKLFADGTIFQSNWSREKNYQIGMRRPPYETIIRNAPDPNVFNSKHKKQPNEKKLKLIASSWSSNIGKGFDIYRFLDEHLDFNRYQMTFVGNSPIQFNNIKWIRPVPSLELADLLKEHDIYIIASKNDPCSNALLEALHSGLPAVARNDGGHPEIVGKAGELFEDESNVIEAIEKVAQDYKYYQAQLDLPNAYMVGKRYYQFTKNIYEEFSNGSYHPKKASFSNTMGFEVEFARLKAIYKLHAVIRGLKNRGK